LTIRDKKHLAFIRTLPCFKCWKKPSDPAHISTKNDGGMAIKATDKNVIPLCRVCHQEQHRIGFKAFFKDIDKALHLAHGLYLFSGDRINSIQLMLKMKSEVF